MERKFSGAASLTFMPDFLYFCSFSLLEDWLQEDLRKAMEFYVDCGVINDMQKICCWFEAETKLIFMGSSGINKHLAVPMKSKLFSLVGAPRWEEGNRNTSRDFKIYHRGFINFTIKIHVKPPVEPINPQFISINGCLPITRLRTEVKIPSSLPYLGANQLISFNCQVTPKNLQKPCVGEV